MVKINDILYYSLFLSGIFLIFPPYKSLSLMFLFSFFVAWCANKIIEGYDLNQNFKILIYISLWLNIFGELYSFYHWFIYDKILHYFIPIIITAMVYDYSKKELGITDKKIVFICTIGLLTLFEIYEYLFYYFINPNIVGVLINNNLIMSPFDDTMLDLIFGLFGSLTYLIFKK